MYFKQGLFPKCAQLQITYQHVLSCPLSEKLYRNENFLGTSLRSCSTALYMCVSLYMYVCVYPNQYKNVVYDQYTHPHMVLPYPNIRYIFICKKLQRTRYYLSWLPEPLALFYLRGHASIVMLKIPNSEEWHQVLVRVLRNWQHFSKKFIHLLWGLD